LTDPVVAQARAAIARGDLLAAYDLVRPDREEWVTAERAYLAVLAMARMGAVQEASRLYASTGLADATDVDSLSLGARLLKDRALGGDAGTVSFAQAAAAYAGIFERTGDYFPAINAATLSLLAGDDAAAAAFARAALASPAVEKTQDYYGGATKAEALIILGDLREAETALKAALVLPGADFGARSTTMRQFTLLAGKIGAADQLGPMIELLRPPAVAFYTGHIFIGDPAREAKLADRIDAALQNQRIGFAYGALAAGADILIAERLLASGAELNILLPFDERDFIAQSVLPASASPPSPNMCMILRNSDTALPWRWALHGCAPSISAAMSSSSQSGMASRVRSQEPVTTSRIGNRQGGVRRRSTQASSIAPSPGRRPMLTPLCAS
jgi:hypothetical protein